MNCETQSPISQNTWEIWKKIPHKTSSSPRHRELVRKRKQMIYSKICSPHTPDRETNLKLETTKNIVSLVAFRPERSLDVSRESRLRKHSFLAKPAVSGKEFQFLLQEKQRTHWIQKNDEMIILGRGSHFGSNPRLGRSVEDVNRKKRIASEEYLRSKQQYRSFKHFSNIFQFELYSKYQKKPRKLQLSPIFANRTRTVQK